MSGTNPFRRKDTIQQSHVEFNAQADNVPVRANAYVPPIDTDVPKPPKSKVGKTVRIISPHSASSDHEDDASRHQSLPSRIFSPPPNTISQGSSDEEDDDPFDSAQDEEASFQKARKTPQNEQKAVKSDSSNPSTMPFNPFKKTLASMEQGGGSISTEALTPSNPKAQYGVDEFTKLLLTGERTSTTQRTTAVPPVSFPIHQPNQQAGVDTSSNTDASSSSRASLFDATPVPQHDSPRTSQEMSISDDERQSLMGTSTLKAEKLKPSTPRHRHGKLVKANAPQIVPFEDPTLTIFEPTSDLPASNIPASSKPPSHRTTFVSEGHSTRAGQPSSLPSPSPPRNGSRQAQAEPVSNKKSPPAPPPSRRHGQARPRSFAAEANRSVSIAEEVQPEAEESSYSPSANTPKPPPPPRRRSGSVRQDSSSSIPTAASFETTAGQSTPARPTLTTPPTRSPSITATQRAAQPSPQSSSPSMPPPPPPRRRGSSQSSYTPSRLSGDYRNLLSQRPRGDSGASSISQLQMPPAESPAEKKDVLADLSALQREVDELRGKMNK